MNITTTRTIDKGRHIAVYSRGKMGKTSFLADAIEAAGDNGLMVLFGEDGLSEHDKYKGKIPVVAKDDGDYRVFGESGHMLEWEAALNTLKEIYADWAAPGKILAIDSVDLLINGSCQEYCIETYFEEKTKYNAEGVQVPKTKSEQAMEFGGNQLMRHMAREFDRFLTIIKYIQNKGVTVYTSWHSSVFKWKNPFEDSDYDKVCVDLHATKESNLREMLKNSCSMLLFADTKTRVDNKTKRASGGDRAYLFSEANASFDATKGRGVNLPKEVLFDYKVFAECINPTPPKKEKA